MLWKYCAIALPEYQYLDFLAHVLPPKNLSSGFYTAWKAGIQVVNGHSFWIPASAGMTAVGWTRRRGNTGVKQTRSHQRSRADVLLIVIPAPDRVEGRLQRESR